MKTLLTAIILAAAAVTLTPSPAAAVALAPCSGIGATAADSALAAALNNKLGGKMDGFMDAYRVSCARAVVNQVRLRGLHQHAATIAITTTIVETGIRNISETLDHDSLGLFQQRASWGSVSQRLDPEWATDAFLNKMRSLYPNNSWRNVPVGQVCQAVQVSAFPSRYQPEAADGQIIGRALWDSRAHDFDRDSDVDLVARSAATQDLHLYKGNGVGGFQSGTGAAFSNNWSAFDMIVPAGDFDRDGDMDLIARSAATKDLHLYKGNGAGGFQTGTGAAFSNNWSAFDMIIPAGDFDSDGDVDLIARATATKDLHLYRGNSAGGFQSGTGAAFSNNWSAFDMIFAAGDFDRDGDVDLIARSAATEDLHLYKGNGAGGFQTGTGAAFSNNWSAFDMIIPAGDFDSDGDVDLIARATATKDLHLYRGNGAGGFQSGTGAAFSNNWSAFDRIL